MLQLRAKILYNKKIKDNYFRLVLRAPGVSKESSPGQFLNIKVSDGYEPLLRRPFSIHRATGISIELLYEVVGEATQVLSGRKPGQYLSVVGPLGNGFTLAAKQKACNILVAGGMGVAPLFFLAEKLLNRPKPQVLIGATTSSKILCEKEFKNLGCNVKITTDDGSRGFKGKATDLLKEILRTTNNERQTTMYACGPRPMLKEISLIAKKHKIPGQVSMEEHMACGIGVCLGCAVNTKEGFKRVCKEGPVFDGDEIIW